jgi:glutathione synthase/RimK-type ligase-like ATP-grasp enzyme
MVRLVTSSDFADLAVDDRELLFELQSRDIPTEAAVWDDPDVDWAESSVCVLRSVYDYHLRRDEFLAWADLVSSQSVLRNSIETVRWNSHKSYLAELDAAGLPVIETEWFLAGDPVDIETVCKQRQWTEAIVKPAVSASAHETLRFSTADPEGAQRHAERLLGEGDVMVQPYLEEIEHEGETSIIWLAGRRTHAARRPSGLHSTIEEARQGTPLVPRQEEVALATKVYEAIQPPPLYARVDMVDSAAAGLLLLELELIEPALYLRHSPAAVSIFADGIVRLLEEGE